MYCFTGRKRSISKSGWRSKRLNGRVDWPEGCGLSLCSSGPLDDSLLPAQFYRFHGLGILRTGGTLTAVLVVVPGFDQ